jgi:hypothetical protein
MQWREREQRENKWKRTQNATKIHKRELQRERERERESSREKEKEREFQRFKLSHHTYHH